MGSGSRTTATRPPGRVGNFAQSARRRPDRRAGRLNLCYKGLLDKLGVTANVYRVGTYKSAVEPFIRNDMSPEAKANYTALDQARLETWRQEIRQAQPQAISTCF